MSKDQFSAFFLPFLVKSGLFGVNPDHFLTNFFKKGWMQTKIRKKTPNQIEAQIRCPSDIEFVWVVKLLGVLAHFHVKPNLG